MPSIALTPRRMLALRLAGLLVIAALLLACGSTASPRPRDVTLGVDACDYCHMTVDDVSRAAQWVPVSGRALLFDEPGCLLAWLARNPSAEGEAFVALEPDGAWITADSAVFLGGALRTGMGFDVVAMDPAAAGERAEGGELLTWTELRRKGVGDAHAH